MDTDTQSGYKFYMSWAQHVGGANLIEEQGAVAGRDCFVLGLA